MGVCGITCDLLVLKTQPEKGNFTVKFIQSSEIINATISAGNNCTQYRSGLRP